MKKKIFSLNNQFKVKAYLSSVQHRPGEPPLLRPPDLRELKPDLSQKEAKAMLGTQLSFLGSTAVLTHRSFNTVFISDPQPTER